MLPAPTIEILLADDHPLFLLSLEAIIEPESEMKIVGKATNGNELVQLARKLKPNIIVTDIMMPGLNGIEAVKVLIKEFPDIGIIALSMVDKESVIINMLEAGVKGYVLKSDPIYEIGRAIKSVFKDETYFSKDIINSVIRSVRSGSYKGKKAEFSENEIAIMKLICEEKSNSEIAKTLHLNIRTVEWHRTKLLEKTGAKNIAGLVVYAMRNNIFE